MEHTQARRAAARRTARRSRCASPVQVAVAAIALLAALLLVATGGEASTLRALHSAGPDPAAADATTTATATATAAAEDEVIQGAYKGLPDEEDADTTKALEADYDKATEKELEYYTYKVLDFIHKAHVGLEYVEIAKHKVEHSRELTEAVTKAGNVFKTEMSALKVVFSNYATAFSTSNTFIAVRKTLEQVTAPGFADKVSAKAGPKATSQSKAVAEAVTESRGWIKAHLPRVRSAAAYLAEYGRAARALKVTWFAKMGPLVREAVALPRTAAASRVTGLVKRMQYARRATVKAGFDLIRRTSTMLARLTQGGGRLAVSALDTVVSHKFIHGVLYLGVAVEAVYGAMTSKAATTPGLVVDAVLKGGIGYLIMSNPVVALVDLVLPKSLRLSSLAKGVSDTLVGIAELAFTGDSTMMDRVHKASLDGKYGIIMNTASAIGEAMTGNWGEIQRLNERNLSGKNGAIVHMASAYGDAIFNGNFQSLNKYQEMALAGEHGVVAKVLAQAGEFMATVSITDAMRSVWDSVLSSSLLMAPEDRPIVIKAVPSGRGLYVKIRNCVGAAVTQAARPMWTCKPVGASSRAQRRLVSQKRTNVGFQRQQGTGDYEWDYNADRDLAGYGLFWSGVTFTRSVTCTLGDSVRIWPDKHFHNTNLVVRASKENDRRWTKANVVRDEQTLGTCDVLTAANGFSQE